VGNLKKRGYLEDIKIEFRETGWEGLEWIELDLKEDK
jgi:hypothetical protein